MVDESTKLINRYSVLYLDRIDALAVFRDNKNLVFEGTLADSGKALEILANYYSTDRDNLDESYNKAVNDIRALLDKYMTVKTTD